MPERCAIVSTPSTASSSNGPEQKGSRRELEAFAQIRWEQESRPAQRAPEGDWRVWAFIGGRGAGKTRAGAEWVRGEILAGRAGRFALIAPTLHDAREVMVDGVSGLARIDPSRPVYEASRRRLIWGNGAIAQVFSAEDPDSLRGPQFDAAWADELAAWRDPDAVLATLRPALRLGRAPRLLVTTTPRPIPALRALIAEPGAVVTRSATRDNAANLAPGFVAALEDLWAGTARARQELDGELIEDAPDALWRRDLIRRAPPAERARCEDIVVAVDPPAGEGAGADACGIVACGAFGEGRAREALTLADASAQGLSPHGWANRAAELARNLGGARIVAEANQGGEMVRAVLRLADPEADVRLVRASRAKRARAEPIAALYEQGRVRHAGVFPALEDEMCAFGAADFRGSPDRVDALVWALGELMLGRADPRLRAL